MNKIHAFEETGEVRRAEAGEYTVGEINNNILGWSSTSYETHTIVRPLTESDLRARFTPKLTTSTAICGVWFEGVYYEWDTPRIDEWVSTRDPRFGSVSRNHTWLHSSDPIDYTWVRRTPVEAKAAEPQDDKYNLLESRIAALEAKSVEAKPEPQWKEGDECEHGGRKWRYVKCEDVPVGAQYIMHGAHPTNGIVAKKVFKDALGNPDNTQPFRWCAPPEPVVGQVWFDFEPYLITIDDTGKYGRLFLNSKKQYAHAFATPREAVIGPDGVELDTFLAASLEEYFQLKHDGKLPK